MSTPTFAAAARPTSTKCGRCSTPFTTASTAAAATMQNLPTPAPTSRTTAPGFGASSFAAAAATSTGVQWTLEARRTESG